MQDIEDFFFGKMNKTKEGFYQLGLSEIIKLGEMVSPDFFYTQLNRYYLIATVFWMFMTVLPTRGFPAFLMLSL